VSVTLRRCVATAAVIAGLAACSSSDDTTTAAEPDDGSIVAQVASYELVADRDQRFIVGMFDEELGMLSYGAIDLTFRYLGTAQEQVDEPRPGLSTTATFVPVPGSSDQPDAEPQFTSPSQARGVYGAEDVRFDEPGFWQVQVDFQAGGEARAPRRRSRSATSPTFPSSAIRHRGPRTCSPGIRPHPPMPSTPERTTTTALSQTPSSTSRRSPTPSPPAAPSWSSCPRRCTA
jgi:hypothetical protein